MELDLRFESMMLAARHFPGLALATSFIQVEFGVKELEAHWAGFVDSINYYQETLTQIGLYNSFTEGLEDFIEIALSAPV